ncbi:hypothetical protein CJ030_MR0G007682 [Morella rubra]|uniref:Uncharacterized protein n=1 Tax=Morella rubra TaxID=262757 RepID=A0A6A1UJ93_9ROSI|nr:hypothetical protein CJ030_MR0G007682 [Morella rubra]
MPAGGKRLRCDSSVRAESSPSTLAVSGPSLRDRNELPSPTTASPVGTKVVVRVNDFQLDYDQTENCITVTSTMNTVYKTHKNRMFQHYSVFNSKEEALEHPYPDMNKEEWTCVYDLFANEEFQRRSAINKENRAKLKIVHTSGARSSNTKKWRCYSCNTSQRESHTPKWRSSLRLGTKAGYVRGLGRSVRSVGSSSSASSVDLSRRLEEARLQIEEMRARQLEYEALLVKWSDMEQRMQSICR